MSVSERSASAKASSWADAVRPTSSSGWRIRFTSDWVGIAMPSGTVSLNSLLRVSSSRMRPWASMYMKASSDTTSRGAPAASLRR